MRYIQKTKEPRSLQQHRALADSGSQTIFDDYPNKKTLRQILLKEQGYICCYCMKRIKGEIDDRGRPDTRIEHWAPQSIYNGREGKPDLRLAYKNLLASCRGNEGQSQKLQHCDKNKGDQEIKLNPTQTTCETQILYNGLGEIYSLDSEIDNDLDIILNLNIQTLKENRLCVLDDILDEMKREMPVGDWSVTFIQRKIDRLSERNQRGYHREYFAFAVFHLMKMLARAK